MKHSNILSIVDIESTEFYPEFIQWLHKEFEPTYKDNDFDSNEHIYSIGRILDNQIEGENNGYPSPPMFLAQLKEINSLCEAFNSGYFRIV